MAAVRMPRTDPGPSQNTKAPASNGSTWSCSTHWKIPTPDSAFEMAQRAEVSRVIHPTCTSEDAASMINKGPCEERSWRREGIDLPPRNGGERDRASVQNGH